MITEDGTLTLPYNVNITGDLNVDGDLSAGGSLTTGGNLNMGETNYIYVGNFVLGRYPDSNYTEFAIKHKDSEWWDGIRVNNEGYLKVSDDLHVSGGLTVRKRVHIQDTTDVGLTNANAPLVIGPKTGTHIEIDGNEIMAKSDATTASGLYLNNEGGLVQTGGDLNVVGNGIIGNAYVGKLGTTNNTYATFCHKNQKSAGKKYSICQNSSGATWLNSSGTINVRKNDATSGARLLIYGNIVLNNKVDIYENGSGDRNPRIVFKGNNLNVQMYYEPGNKNNYLRLARDNNKQAHWP